MKSIETNIRMVGRIHAMPRKIYWIAMPESFKEKEKVELLQQDIWVIPFSIEKIPELEGEANIIIFVDLDKTLFSGRASKVASESAIANSLIENIRTVKPLHIIVHTTHINPALKSIFGQASLTYLEKNLYDTTAALATIIKTVNYLYDKTNSNKRAFLRIELDEKNRIPVKCRIKNNPASLIEGYIGDISMNGLQIVLKNPEIIHHLSLKDFIEISFSIGTYVIKIHRALIARMDSKNNSIGVYFEIFNENMIRRDIADHYSEIMYQMIKEIQKAENL